MENVIKYYYNFGKSLSFIEGGTEKYPPLWEGLENKIYPIKIYPYIWKNNISMYGATPSCMGNLWYTSCDRIFGLKKFSEGTIMAMASYGNKNKYYKK